MAFLFNFLAALVISLLTSVLSFLSFLAGLYTLAALVPGLAITVRRLRDAGKAWYCIFFSFIPLVGAIILIVFLCKPTASGVGQQV